MEGGRTEQGVIRWVAKLAPGLPNVVARGAEEELRRSSSLTSIAEVNLHDRRSGVSLLREDYEKYTHPYDSRKSRPAQDSDFGRREELVLEG